MDMSSSVAAKLIIPDTSLNLPKLLACLMIFAREYSIRINDQFRICFRWSEDDAYDVDITDYH